MEALKKYIKQIRGVSYKPEDLHNKLDGNSVVLLRANNIDNNGINLDDVVYVDRSKVNEIQYLRKGDILICASSGSKHLVGKSALIKKELIATFGAFCKVVRPQKGFSEYWGYYFESDYYRTRISNVALGANINNIRNEHIDNLMINYHSESEQKEIIRKISLLDDLLVKKSEQLACLDLIIKSRFVEMFGDPIVNSKGLPTEAIGDVCLLKAGVTTSAQDIHEQSDDEHNIPCYGGNGVRGYVRTATYQGDYAIIGRQGALCGNVQFAHGNFHATEHAVLVTPKIPFNLTWLYITLREMNLNRFHTGAAQPGLAVKTLNKVRIMMPDIELQNRFAELVVQADKSKLAVQQSIETLQMLKAKLMQDYFG